MVKELRNKYKIRHEKVSAKTGENVEDAINKFLYEVLWEKAELVPLKDIFMSFLLHLNEDFDDDLLLDAMDILVSL